MPLLRIFPGPLGSGKKEIFWSELKRHLKHDSADTLLYLVPCFSYAKQIERAMLEDLPGFFSWPLTTFGSLFKDLFSAMQDPRSLAGVAVLESLLMGLLENTRNEGAFFSLGESATSRGMCAALGRLFNTFERHSLMDATDIRRAIGEKDMIEWKHLDDALLLYSRYRDTLQSNGLIAPGHAGALVCNGLRARHVGLMRRLLAVKLLIIDGFFSFSPLEEELVVSLIKVLPETWVGLDIDTRGSDEVFELPRRTLARLQSLSGHVDVRIEPLPGQETKNEARRTIANSVYADRTSGQVSEAGAQTWREHPAGLLIIEAHDPRDEFQGMARAIKRLVVDERCEPERIVVTFPQLSEREHDLRTVFGQYGIPVAGPERLQASHSASVRSVLSTIEMVQQGFRRSDVLEFLRSPYLRPEGILKRADGERQRGIDVEYIDARTKEAKIQGGGQAGVNSYRVGFAALRRQVERSRNREEAIGAGDKQLRKSDKQTGFLVQVLEALDLRFGRPCTPEAFRIACLGLISELRVFDRTVIAFHEARDTSSLQAELKALSQLVKTIEEVCLGLSAAGTSEASPRMLYSGLLMGLKHAYVSTSRESKGVRLLPIKEAWLADCDYLFCGGLTETGFPGPTRADVFLPKEARARLGLPAIDEKVAESKFLVHALLMSASGRVWFSYPSSVDEKPSLPATALLEIQDAAGIAPQRWQDVEMPRGRAYASTELQAALGSLARGNPSQHPKELLPEALTVLGQDSSDPSGAYATPRGIIRRVQSALPQVGDGPELNGVISQQWRGQIRELLTDEKLSQAHGRRVFYVSRAALDDYLTCPFKFFASRILKLKPEDEFDADIAAKDLGTLLHKVLCSFYRGRRRPDGTIERVTLQNRDAARSRVRAIATEHIPLWVPPGAPTERVSSLLLGQQGLLDAFIESEAADESSFEPTLLEASFGPVTGHGRSGEVLSPEPLLLRCEVDGSEEMVAVNGVIDRVDMRTDGGQRIYRVLDYKTGTIPGPKEIREGTSLQLPIYVAAIGQALRCDATAAYYVLSETEGVRMRDYSKKDELEAAVRELPLVVSGVLRSILAGSFPPRPKNDNDRLCSWCDFRTVCRRPRLGSSAL
ncbi:MAG TPA: PD-(D/E)XK nuclease family protein [bacterium]|nr:PD-(D/E)XK nuclease family protein [bacterium]